MKKPKVSEKHEMTNADSTTVPQSWLKKRWYADPKRKAIGASGKNVKVRVGGGKVSQAYKDGWERIFGNSQEKIK